MKTFNRCKLPISINYNKRSYTFLTGSFCKETITNYCNDNGYKLIQINVLSRKLKGVTDLHGKLYKPSEFFYCSPKMSQDEKDILERKLEEEFVIKEN